MQFLHKVRGFAIGAVGVVCMGGVIYLPLEAKSSGFYTRRCKTDPPGWVIVSGTYVRENSISRYDRGLDYMICDRAQTYHYKIDCISRTLYYLANNLSYVKYGTFHPTSSAMKVCEKYYF